MIHRSLLPPVDIPLLSLPEFVLQRAAEVPDEPAPIDGLTGRVLVTAPRSIDTALRAANSAGVKGVYVFGRAEGAVPLPRPDKPRAGKP